MTDFQFLFADGNGALEGNGKRRVSVCAIMSYGLFHGFWKISYQQSFMYGFALSLRLKNRHLDC